MQMISVCMAFSLCEDLRFAIMPGRHLKTTDTTSVSLPHLRKDAKIRSSREGRACPVRNREGFVITSRV